MCQIVLSLCSNSVMVAIINHSVPSLPPRNVQGSVASSTNILLTWEAPVSSGQNGIIQHYVVRVTEVETMREFLLTSVTTSISAVDLHPYYTYSFTVAAVTIGQGPSTPALSLQTLEDGEQHK